MVIIGILASIAIPVLLQQRANAYRDAVRSDVKNAPTAAESFATGTGGGGDAGRQSGVDCSSSRY